MTNYTLQDVSRETLNNIKKYVDILIKWNQKINLIGRSTESILWDRHIKESFVIKNYIDKDEYPIIDLGTGAGFPGVILAMILKNDVYLVDANHKKTSFLNYVKTECNLSNVTIINSRIEDINNFPNNNIIVSRALATINNIYNLTEFNKNNIYNIYIKGSKLYDEIKEAQKKWSFDYNIIESQNDMYLFISSNIKAK